MSGVTDNYGFILPAEGEAYDVDITNSNNIAIDAQIKLRESYANGDRIQLFQNAGFVWGGALQEWDAGVLSADANAAQSSQVSPSQAFAIPGSVSGSIKLLEAGLYEAYWYVRCPSSPASSGYRIVMLGTWPGNPVHPDIILGQGTWNDPYNESECRTKVFRAPVPNLEIRFTGKQTNGMTNVSKIAIRKIGKI